MKKVLLVVLLFAASASAQWKLYPVMPSVKPVTTQNGTMWLNGTTPSFYYNGTWLSMPLLPSAATATQGAMQLVNGQIQYYNGGSWLGVPLTANIGAGGFSYLTVSGGAYTSNTGSRLSLRALAGDTTGSAKFNVYSLGQPYFMAVYNSSHTLAGSWDTTGYLTGGSYSANYGNISAFAGWRSDSTNKQAYPFEGEPVMESNGTASYFGVSNAHGGLDSIVYEQLSGNQLQTVGAQTFVGVAGRYSYTFKSGNNYYLFVHADSSEYLYTSTNKTTWTVMNGGSPVLHNVPGTGLGAIYNVAVCPVAGTWHMLIEAKAGSNAAATGQFQIYYSYSDSLTLNWNTHMSASPVIPNASAPELVYVPDRNALIGIVSQCDSYNGNSPQPLPFLNYITGFTASLSSNLALPATWIAAPNFPDVAVRGIVISDPEFLVTGQPGYNLMLWYSYNQGAGGVYAVSSNLSLDAFYDVITLQADNSASTARYMPAFNGGDASLRSLKATGSVSAIGPIYGYGNIYVGDTLEANVISSLSTNIFARRIQIGPLMVNGAPYLGGQNSLGVHGTAPYNGGTEGIIDATSGSSDQWRLRLGIDTSAVTYGAGYLQALQFGGSNLPILFNPLGGGGVFGGTGKDSTWTFYGSGHFTSNMQVSGTLGTASKANLNQIFLSASGGYLAFDQNFKAKTFIMEQVGATPSNWILALNSVGNAMVADTLGHIGVGNFPSTNSLPNGFDVKAGMGVDSIMTFTTQQRLTSADGSFFPQSTQTTVSGSTSGSAIFSEPFQGGSYKKIVIYCSNLTGTASYTYPTPFVYTPVVVTTSGPAASVVTSKSATSCTVTGSATSGILVLEGY